MKSRIVFGGLLVLGVLSLASDARVSPVRQWAIVNFDKTTDVSGALLSPGEYLIVHDAEKMARGDACTTFYRLGELGNGAQEEAVSFNCIPRERDVAGKTRLTLTPVSGETRGRAYGWGWAMNKLTAYQFAGDSEEHGVPDCTPALASAEDSAESGHAHDR